MPYALKGFTTTESFPRQSRGLFYGCDVPFRCSDWNLNHSPEPHQNFAGSAPVLCRGVHQKACDLEGVEGSTPHTPLLKAMTIKSLFTYTLFLALGIGAVTNAKALLIEQEPQETAQTEELAYRISHAPNQWHRWTV